MHPPNNASSHIDCEDIEGVPYLTTDLAEQCFTPRYNRYRKAAVFFLLLYVFGIPLYFLYLFYRYEIPQNARKRRTDSLLRAVVEFFFSNNIPQPECDVRHMTVVTISDEHVDRLHAHLFLGKKEADEEGRQRRATGATEGEDAPPAAEASGALRTGSSGSAAARRAATEGDSGHAAGAPLAPAPAPTAEAQAQAEVLAEQLLHHAASVSHWKHASAGIARDHAKSQARKAGAHDGTDSAASEVSAVPLASGGGGQWKGVARKHSRAAAPASGALPSAVLPKMRAADAAGGKPRTSPDFFAVVVQVYSRYVIQKNGMSREQKISEIVAWSEEHLVRTLPRCPALAVALCSPCGIHLHGSTCPRGMKRATAASGAARESSSRGSALCPAASLIGSPLTPRTGCAPGRLVGA